MFEIEKLSKSFGREKILKDLSVSFNDKGVTVIVGLNGSGKTVFLNTISGIYSVDSGRVSLNGQANNSKVFKESIFYIPSDSYLPEYLTGQEYAEFVQSRYSLSDKEVFLVVVELLEMTEALKKPIETYSFGMKKKLQIALALSLRVGYILADEVFSGLDLETIILVQELFALYSRDHKIILVSHERNIINKFSDDILLMRNGELTAFVGNVDELSDYIYKEGGVNEKLSRIEKLV